MLRPGDALQPPDNRLRWETCQVPSFCLAANLLWIYGLRAEYVGECLTFRVLSAH